MEEEKKDKKNEVMEWIESIVIAVVIALLIKTFILNTTFVKGNSMYPTLHEKDRLFANKIQLYFSRPKRGDIVLIDAPDQNKKKYIKRVVGLEGDKIDIIDGKVYLNGQALDEEYTEPDSYTDVYSNDSWLVDKGHIFVLGDNRAPGASKDSRYFGQVAEDSVLGIAKYRYYPFGRFGKIDK